MKITPERWRAISTPLIALFMVYFAADAFGHDTTNGLAWGSLLLWNSVVIFASYLWWLARRRSIQSATRKLAPGARTRLLGALGGSAAVFVGGCLVGVRLLEQDSLGLQALGILLLVIAALMVPAWAVWDLRLAGGRTKGSTQRP
jgi:hypothetical protein